MTDTTKVRRIGGSLGVILPKAVAAAMALHEGDDVFVTGTPDAISLTPYDPEFAAAIDDARAFMRSHRDAFRELAR